MEEVLIDDNMVFDIDNLYQNFDKSFFIEQVKKFQLPRNKRTVSYTHLDVYKRQE